MREVDLTYMALRLKDSGIKRYLFAHTEEHSFFGDPTFDFLAYFGFGSGELRGQYPTELAGLRFGVYAVKGDIHTDELLRAGTSYTLNNTKADPFGFIVHKGKTYNLVFDPKNGVDILHLSLLDWSYYTSLGNRRHADGILGAMERHHFMGDKVEQLDVLSKYKNLIEL